LSSFRGEADGGEPGPGKTEEGPSEVEGFNIPARERSYGVARDALVRMTSNRRFGREGTIRNRKPGKSHVQLAGQEKREGERI